MLQLRAVVSFRLILNLGHKYIIGLKAIGWQAKLAS